MDDLMREKSRGLSIWYLKDALPKRVFFGKKFHTPGFGHAARLFAIMAKNAIDKLGPDEGETLIKLAVEEFAFTRGQRIAEIVRSKGLPLTIKNWLIHSDISPKNFKVKAKTEDGALKAEVTDCVWNRAAEQWGLGEYSRLYCKYADYKILEGYNPDIELTLDDRFQTGADHCLFRYQMTDGNK